MNNGGAKFQRISWTAWGTWQKLVMEQRHCTQCVVELCVGGCRKDPRMVDLPVCNSSLEGLQSKAPVCESCCVVHLQQSQKSCLWTSEPIPSSVYPDSGTCIWEDYSGTLRFDVVFSVEFWPWGQLSLLSFSALE